MEQEGIFCLGYKVRDNKFLGVQVRERQGCSRCVPTEKAFLSFLIVWVRDKGAQRDREAKVFQVIDDDIAVAQRWLEDKQPEEKTNTDCLVKEQEKEYQTAWKIKMGNVLDYCNQRSTQQCTKSGVAKHLDVAWIEHQNGLVDETNVTLFAKVKCIFLGYHKSIKGNKLWRLDDVTLKVVLYMNMGFNKSGEYKKTFIGFSVGTGSMQVLHGFEFEVEPLGDHTFEVEPQENIDQGASLQEVQTQDLMDYQLARDREQHLACELFRYRENSNEAAFAIAAVEKICAHESLTFNNTVACEVISKWKAGLKDDMDARSDVYVLSNGCRKCNDDSDVYYWGYTPTKGNVLGMKIIRDQSGYTLRMSQSMFYNEKLVHTLLEGHFILSLEGSLSRDYDVEKNGKWSCIYAVGSQEYQMVCTILDIASADVGMLDKFDRGLQTDVKVFVDFDYAMGRSIIVMALSTTKAGYMTFTEAWKKKIWLKGLLTESIYELRLVVGIATDALVKGGSRSEVPAQVKVAAYRY
uniref:Zinc finger, CCHC-type n=1 Tax=Tanacetum cinerariifolium TaxID=118510 RepID=A0A6L2KGE3_TANCI|nr:zinc finger, CCHC-type [Tanacetum cinerariifolium]